MLDPCIFSCRGLAVLDLAGCDVPSPPPSFAGLPNLTTLSLSNVGFPQGVKGMELLISSSPSLQTLRIVELRVHRDDWVIHAPNLRSLYIVTWEEYDWQVKHLPSLEVAEFIAYFSADGDFVNLISGMDQARELRLSMPIIDWMIAREEIDMNFLNAQWTDDMFSKLIRVEMKNVNWELNEIYFVEFVLFKARQLQVFNVHYQSGRGAISDEDAFAKLAKCTTASPGANLSFCHSQDG